MTTPDRFTVDALVIREQQIGESDKLVTLLSRHNGVIRAYASGARSIKSKKGGATSLLAYSSFTLVKKGDTYRITEAVADTVFFKAGDDIEALSLAQYFCELCKTDVASVEKGIFGAEMELTIVNDGPVTIVMDSNVLLKKTPTNV